MMFTSHEYSREYNREHSHGYSHELLQKKEKKRDKQECQSSMTCVLLLVAVPPMLCFIVAVSHCERLSFEEAYIHTVSIIRCQ